MPRLFLDKNKSNDIISKDHSPISYGNFWGYGSKIIYNFTMIGNSVENRSGPCHRNRDETALCHCSMREGAGVEWTRAGRPVVKNLASIRRGRMAAALRE